MRLYEFEGKELLRKYGIAIPNSVLYQKDAKIPFQNAIIKAQTLSGGRGKAGLVRTCSKDEVKEIIEEMKGKLHNFELVEKILIEEKIEPKKEFYIAITYDTDLGSALIAFFQNRGKERNKIFS